MIDEDSNKCLIRATKLSHREAEIEFALGETCFILGRCDLYVKEGTIDIYGYRAQPSSRSVSIYSPKCSALVSISCVSNSSVIRINSISNGLDAVQSVQSAFSDIFNHSEQPEIIHGCWILKNMSTLNTFVPGPRWDSIASELCLLSNQIIVVAGARKVGKSSLCRYITNRLLNFHEKVAFIDFDCGQTEFTPPGFISFKVLSAPLMCCPFANMSHKPDFQSFYGHMSPSDDMRLYLSLCMDLWTKFNNQAGPRIPVVINTLGWVTGLGLGILSHLLHFIRPSHILAFGDSPPTGEDYVSRALFNDSGFAGSQPYEAHENSTVVAYIPSTTRSLGYLLTSPADSRSLMFWAYFYYNPSTLLYDFATPLSKKIPFAIKKTSIDIHFRFPIKPTSFWSSINCTLVGLCISNVGASGKIVSNSNCLESKAIGMGFVRGVDPQKCLIFVATPLSLEDISMCNTMIVSPVSLPAAIFAHGQLFDGPYFSYQSACDTSGFNVRKVRHNIVRRSTGNK